MEIKNIRVMKKINDYNFEIIRLSEVNIHWTLVKPDNSWEEITSGN